MRRSGPSLLEASELVSRSLIASCTYDLDAERSSILRELSEPGCLALVDAKRLESRGCVCSPHRERRAIDELDLAREANAADRARRDRLG